jgi:hypothetical protein
MFRLSNNLPVTVYVVLPLGDHQVNSVEIVEIHEAVLPLWAIFIRYSGQRMKYCLHVPMEKLSVFGILIGFHRIHKYFGLPEPDPCCVVLYGSDPSKKSRKKEALLKVT